MPRYLQTLVFGAADDIHLFFFSQADKIRNKTADAYHQVTVIIRVFHCFTQRLAGNNIKLDVVYPQFFDRPQEGYEIVDIAVGCYQLRTDPEIYRAASGEPLLRQFTG